MSDTPDSPSKGKLALAKGFANESRLLAALLERGHNASRVDLPHSTYDIVVEQSAHDINQGTSKNGWTERQRVL